MIIAPKDSQCVQKEVQNSVRDEVERAHKRDSRIQFEKWALSIGKVWDVIVVF